MPCVSFQPKDILLYLVLRELSGAPGPEKNCCMVVVPVVVLVVGTGSISGHFARCLRPQDGRFLCDQNIAGGRRLSLRLLPSLVFWKTKAYP